VPAVSLVSGSESFGQTCLGLVVKLAGVPVQLGNDCLELGAGLQEFQAFGDQCGHRFGAAFLDFALEGAKQARTVDECPCVSRGRRRPSSGSGVRGTSWC
jgi:hypothetical protein